jgi:pimeloyl-ACP methyl ester carboxylesterase
VTDAPELLAGEGDRIPRGSRSWKGFVTIGIKRVRGGRRLAIGVATVVTAGLAAGALSVTASANGATEAVHNSARVKPTIVLEHGAFADASSWNGVITKLRADGYPVVAAANPLRGPASDATALRSVLDHILGPKILVGHSYGGNVITEAAVNDPQVRALVYVAAFLPGPGETALELTSKYPGSTLPDALDPVTTSLPDGTTGTDLYIQQEKFRHQFAADVPADQAALMASRVSASRGGPPGGRPGSGWSRRVAPGSARSAAAGSGR